jgi:hypothetical protein
MAGKREANPSNMGVCLNARAATVHSSIAPALRVLCHRGYMGPVAKSKKNRRDKNVVVSVKLW